MSSGLPVVAAALLAQACAFTPAAPTGELSPQNASAPGPRDGIVVGIVVIDDDGRAPRGYGFSQETGLSFRAPDGIPQRLHLVPAHGDASVSEGGLPLKARPFAVLLPAGRAEFESLEVHVRKRERVGAETVSVCNYFVSPPKCERKEQDVYRVEDFWAQSKVLPPATFEVRPGRVAYIGRIGLSRRTIAYSSERERDAACRPVGRAKWQNAWVCHFEQVFVGSDDADLALIRARYPGLGSLDIEKQPLQFQPGSWRSFTEVRQAPD